MKPRYPVYVPSKGRFTDPIAPTFRTLARDSVPFFVVIEEQDYDQYAALVGEEKLLVLPFSNLGQGSIPARNWIKAHSRNRGAKRHWQLDDNIQVFRRMWRGRRIPCDAAMALRVCEDFTDRYTNVGVSGLNYQMFVTTDTTLPYYHNVHVYSCTLINNAIENRWRGRYNEDTDLCLQVLADGWCTLLLNAFMADKLRTMTRVGGNSDELYVGDGRLAMARELERRWPGVVSVDRRWQRPQHVIKANWRKFDTKLIRRPDLDFDALPSVDEMGLKLDQVAEIKSPYIKALYDEWVAEHEEVAA